MWLSVLEEFLPVVCNDRCQGGAERESLFMRQSTVALGTIFCFSCSRCSLENLVHYFLLTMHLAVTRPVSGCCMRSTHFDYSRLLVRNAWLDSEYMFCIST